MVWLHCSLRWTPGMRFGNDAAVAAESEAEGEAEGAAEGVAEGAGEGAAGGGPDAREWRWGVVFLPKDGSAGLSGNWRGFAIDHE
jgi:hypothetical protein